MTVKDAAIAYANIEAEQREAEKRRGKLKPKCNALLASIVDESRIHNFRPDDFQKILLALLKNTTFEGAEVVDDGRDHRPSRNRLASDVYELGSSSLSYNVWFETYGAKDEIELHFSQVVRPNQSMVQ